MNTKIFLSVLFGLYFFSSCVEEPICLANSMSLKENKVENIPGLNLVKVDFDLTNTSGKDYYPDSLMYTIKVTMNVKTTDGTIYENIRYLSHITSGATKAYGIWGDYGAGKTYQSYSVSMSCD